MDLHLDICRVRGCLMAWYTTSWLLCSGEKVIVFVLVEKTIENITHPSWTASFSISGGFLPSFQQQEPGQHIKSWEYNKSEDFP